MSPRILSLAMNARVCIALADGAAAAASTPRVSASEVPRMNMDRSWPAAGEPPSRSMPNGATASSSVAARRGARRSPPRVAGSRRRPLGSRAGVSRMSVSRAERGHGGGADDGRLAADLHRRWDDHCVPRLQRDRSTGRPPTRDISPCRSACCGSGGPPGIAGSSSCRRGRRSRGARSTWPSSTTHGAACSSSSAGTRSATSVAPRGRRRGSRPRPRTSRPPGGASGPTRSGSSGSCGPRRGTGRWWRATRRSSRRASRAAAPPGSAPSRRAPHHRNNRGSCG